MTLLIALSIAVAMAPTEGDRAGQPVDISSSAYTYRADRSTNPPESRIALMHFAHLPLNRKPDPAATKGVLTSLLWEEIRPVETLELTWPEGRQIPPIVTVTALKSQSPSSSWWNNLGAVKLEVKPTVEGRTYRYKLDLDTCGLIVSTEGDARAYSIPQVQVLVADTWKSMDIEIEWGFDPKTKAKDFSGRLETYDGRASDLRSLGGNTKVSGLRWQSSKGNAERRGVRLNLLYMGSSKWRKQIGFTTPPDDVARTIVTVWTKSGSFSFLAADLENGPILAPEYGFFLRRVIDADSEALNSLSTGNSRLKRTLLTSKLGAILGDSRLKGLGTDATPLVASNPTDQPITVQGVTLPPGSIAMHPGEKNDVVAEWLGKRSVPLRVHGALTHAQSGSNGVNWWLVQGKGPERKVLAHGTTSGIGTQAIPEVTVGPDHAEMVSLVIGPNGDHRCDTMIVELTLQEEESGVHLPWTLAGDVASTLHAGNPHPGQSGSWAFWSQTPEGPTADPPIALDSEADSAKEFVQELARRRLKTIRQQTREHPEQTWQAATEATRGANLPPHPPTELPPPMQVTVPDGRLTAQWNLGVWHLVRHCAKNPTTGKLWFNDFPYGILAAETYLILSVLDQLGAHEAAADGLDQWLSLSLEREHPVGLFTEGKGALTNAVGPDGFGGQMDTVHAFGPGSIGWALTQHYAMTGDAEWLKKNALRIRANAEWMLRQRQAMTQALGKGLWCQGIQPALQVTPDSGGLWMQFYESEAYYWAFVDRLADVLGDRALKSEANAYRRDLRAAVERSIALSPVVPVRDGTFHSVIPFACYVRGNATGAWGYGRDGSGSHVGPLYWDTVQSAAALVSPAGLLPANDPRVQGYLDVLEDRLLLENPNVGDRDWFQAGWQYQGGLERTANLHLAGDDIPVFLRSFLNCYAVDILPNEGYTFNEHAVHGPPDKIFEEAAFLERFRNLLVMEESGALWIGRGCPRAWFAQGANISVKNAPTAFGQVSFDIQSDVEHGEIRATVDMPASPVLLRIRHPQAKPIKSVLVNGKQWEEFDREKETIKLRGLKGRVSVEARY